MTSTNFDLHSDTQVEGQKLLSSIGMTLLLVSFSMLFLTLFLGYTVYRLTAEVWPPMGMTNIPSNQATLSCALIIVSSITYFLYEKKRISELLWVTLILGFGFLISQFNLWSNLQQLGIYAGSGILASLIYGYTWTHAVHMIGGVAALLFLLIYQSRSKSEVTLGIWINNIGKFWHFLGIIWLIIYTLIFVI